MERDLNAATRTLKTLGELPPTQLVTAASLHSLPLELILLIFELGPLKVGDAMMLRSVGVPIFGSSAFAYYTSRPSYVNTFSTSQNRAHSGYAWQGFMNGIVHFLFRLPARASL